MRAVPQCRSQTPAWANVPNWCARKPGKAAHRHSYRMHYFCFLAARNNNLSAQFGVRRKHAMKRMSWALAQEPAQPAVAWIPVATWWCGSLPIPIKVSSALTLFAHLYWCVRIVPVFPEIKWFEGRKRWKNQISYSGSTRTSSKIGIRQQRNESQWAAIKSIASKIGCTAETLRTWVRRTEIDQGIRGGLSTADRERPAIGTGESGIKAS